MTDKDVAHALTQLTEIVREQSEKIAKLSERVGLVARGTEDVTEAAALAMATAPASVQLPLGDRMQLLLRERPHSTEELATRLVTSVGTVVEELRAFKTERRVFNTGNEDRPRWFWVFGPEASAADHTHAVRTLIRTQPMELQDLALATGLKPAQVSAILVKMQRDGEPVENHGTPKRARWYMPHVAAVTPKRR